jgi:hypothetical protein
MIQSFRLACKNALPILFCSLLLCLLSSLLSCASLFSGLSKENVTWEYIQTKSTGLKLSPAQITDSEVIIPLQISPNFDSAICLSEPAAEVSGQRILMNLKKGLCSGEPLPALKLKLLKPKAGTYTLIYADPQAHYPILGQLVIS